ncbi:MAG: phage holin family protein [Candidatus Falkowbacteria bacterium]|nr:phage holin family protein [Candidatus Falkowbacteria bacterium]
MNLILKWLLTAVAIMLSAYLVPGVIVSGFWTAFWLAALLALLNITLKPLLILLTLPINILTLGLFIFVINAVIIWFASTLLKGFGVDSFFSALLFSLVLSIFSYLFNVILKG